MLSDEIAVDFDVPDDEGSSSEVPFTAAASSLLADGIFPSVAVASHEVNFPDADSEGPAYVGDIVDGRRHGHGIWSAGGEKYMGQWKSDMPGGEGCQVWKDGREFRGQFLAGKFHGHGRMGWRTLQGLSAYEGQYVDDLKHGFGKFEWADGRAYDGEWKFGKRSGLATYTSSRGLASRGIWAADKFVECTVREVASTNRQPRADALTAPADGSSEGKVVAYTDGSTYIGQLSGDGQGARGVPNGEGRQVWLDGRVYRGQQREGDFHGQGVMEWRSGAGVMSYEGQYANCQKHGRGKFTWGDGRSYEGEWLDGQRWGEATYTTITGERRRGVWAEDKASRWCDACEADDRDLAAGGDRRALAVPSLVAAEYPRRGRAEAVELAPIFRGGSKVCAMQ